MTHLVPSNQRSWDISAPSNDIVRVLSGEGRASIHVARNIKAIAVSSSTDLEVVLDEGASLEIMRYFPDSLGLSFETSFQVRQAKDSQCRAFLMTQGAHTFKDNVTVALGGSGAEVSLNGLHALKGDADAQSFTFIDHVAPSTKSDQLYKSVVSDKAHSLFNGRIMVRREAQLTNAYQLNKNLILSREARVDTKPQLEIFADDVKCSHGAAIGQLDDDQLFYFQTRGISQDEARRMLIKGFVEDVLESIYDPRLKAEVGGLIHEI